MPQLQSDEVLTASTEGNLATSLACIRTIVEAGQATLDGPVARG